MATEPQVPASVAAIELVHGVHRCRRRRLFEQTLERIVLLAVFLPVLAGQSGNTGCQALAVALRGMTLGELKSGKEKLLVFKEALLGLCNGTLSGSPPDLVCSLTLPCKSILRRRTWTDRFHRDDRELFDQRHLGRAHPTRPEKARR